MLKPSTPERAEAVVRAAVKSPKVTAASSCGIAIIGIACRFPGAADHRAYWRNLCDGIESLTVLTDEELRAAGVPAALLQDPSYVKAASILADIDQFDAAFFEYSPAEARLTDPQQRLLLEVAWEAFEDAGYRAGGSARSVGVFVGSGGLVSSYFADRLSFSIELPGQTGSLAHIGNDKDFPSTRISYKLNLTGPSINVQTACSTSLVAVHLACQAILAGECDMALAGAATVRVPQRVGYLSRRGDILSPDGHCRAFDAEAQGTIFGSGVGAVLLKELDAAIADRDNIYAVIRGSAVNNDGADKVSYTASNVAGQTRAMLEAMLVAEVSPDDIGYVECHGTGTIVGDPLEIDALARAFRTGTDRAGYCAIGSVKTNVGHLEQTAGIAALIKVALMLKNGKIPASLNFRTPNPKIDFAASPFFVNTKCRDWPADRPRLAAVNSLGLGGTNAFVVLEQMPPFAPEAPADECQPHLFTLSAKTGDALHASIERHRSWLEDQPVADLSAICFTASSGRNHFAHRFATLVSSVGQLRTALAEELKKNPAGADSMPAQGKRRRLAFLFSGQGSQHPGMAAELYRHQPVFRAVVDRCAELLRDRLERPLLEALFAQGDGAGAIHETAYTQPALFAVQAALTQLLRSWGIVPDAVLGHSVGEFAAGFCAGVYTLEDGLLLVAERARLMQSLPRTGAMAAIFADENTVAASLGDTANIAVAALNAPRNTVISGEREAVAAVAAHFSALGTASQLLNVSHAFHSPLMQPILDEFQRVAGTISTRQPQISWISTTSGTTLTRPPDAGYWCDHAREAVRFEQGIQSLAKLGVDDFIEIGPGNTLLALGRQCLDGAQAWLGSLGNTSRSDTNEILTTVGKLYVHGYEVDWDRFNEPYRKSRTSLPTYPFEHRRYWLERDASARPRSSYPQEMSLTGQRIRSTLPEVQFETTYSLARFNYLGDHRIYGMPVLPLAAGLTALRDAARQHFGTDQVALANLQYREALVLPDDGERVVQSVLTPIDGSTAEFALASVEPDAVDGWRTHMVGMARKEGWRQDHGRASAPLDEVRLRCPNPIATELYYKTLHAIGLQYGPSFRAIEELRRGKGEALSRVRLPSHLEAADTLHPALLDACLHIYPALIDDYGDFDRTAPEMGHTYLPISIERFRSSGPIAREVWVHAVRRPAQDDRQAITIDIAVYREDGSEAATLEGLSLKQLPPQALEPNARRGTPDWLYQLQWLEQPHLPSPDRSSGEPSGWLILADRGGVGAALADLLTRRGGVCRLVPFAEVAGSVCKHSSSPGDLLKPLATPLAEFAQESVSLHGVVDLWPLDVAASDVTFSELKEAQKIVVGGALALFRAVIEGRSRPDSAARIWLVSRNVISTSPGDVPAPVAAALWGVGRSAALEHPRNWGGLVDLEARENPSPTSDAEELLRELLNGDGEDQVALRAGHRFAARIVRADVPPESSVPFDAEGRYMITGGLGALGVKVAEWLVTRHGTKHLLLVSRRGEEDPNAAHVLGALAVLGAEVVIRKADVTNKQDVRALLAWIKSSDRPLKGIFHCAGGLDDGILMQMDWQKFDRVAAPKIAGGWLLHQLTRELDLDHFVVFSSILSLIGSAGQANYAAANAFLDALVAHRRGKGLPALALNWGPWDESGLATLSGDKGRAIWRARGTEYIPTELGQRALDLLAGSCAGHAAITLTQWPIFFRQFAKVPLLYGELQKETGAGTPTDGALADAISFQDRLNEVPNRERRELLIAFVRQQAMKTLGITDMIDATRPLRELGLDSLMSVTLVNRLESALGIRMSAVKLVQGPSLAQIVDDVLPQLNMGREEADDATAPVSTAVAGRWLVTAAPRAAPRLRLFCFPFAGGGSAVYHSWAQSLDPTIEVVAIEPPGRLGRINEKPIADIDEFVTELTTEMRDVLDRPFAFFGHCLGGLTMYETARRLIHTTGSRPIHLFASGARPPDRILDLGRFEERLTQDLIKLADFRIKLPPYAQPDDVFAELVRHFNIQATEQLLGNRELRQLVLPVVRAEFAMALNYDFVEEPPWDIPITCFAGLDDPYVTRDHALGWGRFTNSRLQVHIRQVAHFAVVDDVDFIHSVINRELRRESSDPTDMPERRQPPRIVGRHHPYGSTNGCCPRVDSVHLNAATPSRG
jgi:acyl transferase domain-containing protein/surfactin synthase thioesterase subunit/acyl carrier protein